MMRSYIAAGTCVLGIVAGATAHAQDRRAVRIETVAIGTGGGTLSDAVFPNAPFSADAVTTVTQTLADGTKIEQRATAKWYRDSSGRVRREQTIIGLDRLNPSAAAQTTISFDSVPGDPAPYTLNPTTKTARRVARGMQWYTLQNGVYRSIPLGLYFQNAGTTAREQSDLNTNRWVDSLPGWSKDATQFAPIPPDAQKTDEQLGTRQVEGVKATGRRRTTVIPAGRIGNDRPIQIVEEQWDSAELNMVISSRFADPRTGVVEYRLTNISRAEPRADLFSVPSDYTVVDPGTVYRDTLWAAPAPPPPPGQRGGARSGRGN
jgi:hypothetical protein